MGIVQEKNTQRVITIAGSVALVAIAAYGVWKWNRADVPTNNDHEKKKKSVANGSSSSSSSSNRQVNNDKVEKQSHCPTKVEEITQIEVEQVIQDDQEVISVKEVKEIIKDGEVVAEQVVVEQVVVEKELEKEIKKELVEAIAELKDEEEYVVVSKEQETTSSTEAIPTTTTATTTIVEESHSCATSSTDETDVWTPEHEITSNDESDQEKANKNTPEKTASTQQEEYIWKADAAATTTNTTTTTTEEKPNEEWSASIVDAPVVAVETVPAVTTTRPLSLYAPVFVPRQQLQQIQPKKTNPKKRLSRAELIEQQRQNHTPHAKARCSHWPRCTNKNCKFWHPFRDCREGENCPFGNKCMFIHPSDYIEPVRVRKNHNDEEEVEQGQQYIQQQFQFAS